MANKIKRTASLLPFCLAVTAFDIQARVDLNSSVGIGGYYINTDQEEGEESNSGSLLDLSLGIHSEGNKYQLISQYKGNYIQDYDADRSNFFVTGSTNLTLGDPSRNYGLEVLHSANSVNENDTLNPADLDFTNTVSLSPFTEFKVDKQTRLNLYTRHSFLWNTDNDLSARDNRLGTNLIHSFSSTQSANLLYQVNYNEELGDNSDNTLIQSVQAGWSRQVRKLKSSAYIGFDFADSDNNDDTNIVTFGLQQSFTDADYSWSLNYRRGITTTLLETTDTSTSNDDTEDYSTTVIEDRITAQLVSAKLCRSCLLTSRVTAIHSNDYDANDKDSSLTFSLGLDKRVYSDTTVQTAYSKKVDYAGSWFNDQDSNRDTFGIGLRHVFTRQFSSQLDSSYAIEDGDTQFLVGLELTYSFN